MNATLYILLACVRYPVSFLSLLVVLPLLVINWIMTGDMEHDTGLLGLICFQLPNWIQENVNAPLVRLHKSYKPIAWTFGKAVAGYRQCIRWWADRAADNYEWRQQVRANINCAKNAKEKRFWNVVKVRMDALIAQQEKA